MRGAGRGPGGRQGQGREGQGPGGRQGRRRCGSAALGSGGWVLAGAAPGQGRAQGRASAGAGAVAGSEVPGLVVCGGGWAGFGAAWGAAQSGFRVTLLDAAARPGGLAGAGGRRPGFELGIKGCWRHYSNVRNVIQQLGLEMDDMYGPYAETAFVSARGTEVVSPVLGDLPRLPAPLGTFVHTNDRFRMLSVVDRLSALPLTKALLEFDLSEASYARYDAMSFAELCTSAGVSPQLRRRFVDPLLVALMFAPPEELSAAAALSVLNSYALAHQPDFDVRWPRQPPSLLFDRWRSRLEDKGARIRADAPVAEILATGVSGGTVSGVRLASGEVIPASAVVLAVGPSALPKVVAASPALQGCPQLAATSGLSTVDVCAVRLWPASAPPRPLPCPSNVFCGVPGAPRDMGGTMYDLGALMGQKCRPEGNALAVEGDVAGAFEVDVYNAGSLSGCSEEELVSFAKRALALTGRAWLDVGVERAAVLRGKALRFAPGSHAATPPTEPAGAPRGLFVAGDCVKQGPAEFMSHRGARGLSQEKALVTGLQAAAAAAKLQGLPPRPAQQAEGDEPHIAAAKRTAQLFVRS